MNNLSPVTLFALGELLVVLVMATIIARSKSSDHETRLVHFAAVILTTLALIFMLSMAMYYWAPTTEDKAGESGKTIFETCVHVIPPIITSLLGYFFGRQESKLRGEPKENSPSE